MKDLVYEAAHVTPSERQVAWQETEFYAFIHFTVNTFTDQEWGSGDEDPKIFDPTELDARQWARCCKEAGMSGMILTAKHHDGFCLWPSKYTDHSVQSSPWKNGKGDLVKEVAEACKEYGLKMGIYLSPWDRHQHFYGDSPVYNQYFVNQLRELLTNYGEIFSVWFDGACGEGPNGKRQIYDWNSYYQTIRELQPGAAISVCGPDVRWCGNEAGHTRNSEWSVVPASLQDNEKIADKSQQVDDQAFRTKVDTSDQDLGSREKIRNADGLIWYPSEVNTSIRPGWFYHQAEDDKVRSLDELVNIYLNSVGGNATFLLNIPPNRKGLFSESDVTRLKELGKTLATMFEHNLASGANIKASESFGECNERNIISGCKENYWSPKPGTEEAWIEVSLGSDKVFDKVLLQEYIRVGQRIEEFVVEVRENNQWKEIYSGTTVGYKKICCLPKVKASELRIHITNSRWCPTLSNLEVY